MDVPNILLDLFYQYRWFVLAPVLMLVVVVLLRGENRLPIAFALVAGALVLFRDHILVRSLSSGLNEFLRQLGQLVP